MNKHLFRLIFSKSLGFLIPVAETTRAQRKPGQTSCSVSAATSTSPFFFLKRLAASLLLAGIPGWASAELLVDPAAGGTHVITAPNGVPVIEIANPNNSGLSHNRFSEFDVVKPGVIFNNSRANGVSQLGGAILGNPNLQRSATAILSEVTGTKPSSLAGALEVFGGRADILISKIKATDKNDPSALGNGKNSEAEKSGENKTEADGTNSDLPLSDEVVMRPKNIRNKGGESNRVAQLFEDMTIGTPVSKRDGAKEASVYVNKGNPQDELKSVQELLYVNGVPHAVAYKGGFLQRSGLSDQLLTKLGRGESLQDQGFAGSGIDTSVIVGVNKLSGWYDFAVLASDPGTIFLNKNQDSRFGHTSITHGKPVVLAGEIQFDDQSNIIRWTNKSGHYEVGSHIRGKARAENNPALDTPEGHREYLNSRVPSVDGVPLLPPHLLEPWNGDQ